MEKIIKDLFYNLNVSMSGREKPDDGKLRGKDFPTLSFGRGHLFDETFQSLGTGLFRNGHLITQNRTLF